MILAHAGKMTIDSELFLHGNHRGPRTTPEGYPGEDPQQPSGHDKMPTANLDSCVVARNRLAAGADDYQLPRVLKTEHSPSPAIAAYFPAEVPMGEVCK